jgi:hypothetical protein
MMSKRTIYLMLPVIVLGLMLTSAWAAMPNDLNLEKQFEMGSQSRAITSCSKTADMLADLFILARGGAGGGGAGGGGGAAGGHGGYGGQGGKGSGDHQGQGPMGKSAQEHQNQNQSQHRHQNRNNYGEHSQTQSHYGPGDGTGNDGEGPQDGTGYGADSTR